MKITASNSYITNVSCLPEVIEKLNHLLHRIVCLIENMDVWKKCYVIGHYFQACHIPHHHPCNSCSRVDRFFILTNTACRTGEDDSINWVIDLQRLWGLVGITGTSEYARIEAGNSWEGELRFISIIHCTPPKWKEIFAGNHTSFNTRFLKLIKHFICYILRHDLPSDTVSGH